MKKNLKINCFSLVAPHILTEYRFSLQCPFKIIREVKEKTTLNPVEMTVSQWYKHLLEKFVTRREVDQEGRVEVIPCRVEELYPTVEWGETYRVSRLRGISNETKSFNFKLLQAI